MKRPLASVLLLSLTFLGSVPSAFAAPSKSARAEASLVAALRAVSPDPLGGQLGLVVASRVATTKLDSAAAALARQAASKSNKTPPATSTVANSSPRP